jgi:hypothetical protein
VGAHKAELERAGHAQQIVPITGNEIGVDAVPSDAVERSVVGARIDAIEARLAQIRQPRAEAVAEQHKQPEDDVRVRSRVRVVGPSEVCCSSKPSRMTIESRKVPGTTNPKKPMLPAEV